MTLGVRLPLLFAFVVAVSACQPAQSGCDIARFQDDPTPLGTLLDGCTRARDALATNCPERLSSIEKLSKTDYVTWCRYEVANDKPICPEKVAKARNCEEAAHACR